MDLKELAAGTLQAGVTVALVGVVLLALRSALRRRYPARAMCIVWFALTLRLLVPVQLTLPGAPVTVAPRAYQVVYTAQTSPVNTQPAPVQTAWATREEAAREEPYARAVLDWGAILGALWLAGAGCALIWQAAAYLRFRAGALKVSREVQSEALQDAFMREKRALGVRRAVRLRVSPHAECPLLMGALRPVLLLPDEALGEAEAHFIFRHELTHWKRGHLWLKLLLALAGCLHWFNPCVFLLRRAAGEDLELACDSAVVRGMDDRARKQYGETILRYAGARRTRRRDALLSRFTGDKETLMKRLQNLFDGKAKKRGVALLLAVVLTLGAVGGSFAIGQDAGAADEEAALSETFRTLGEQWAQALVDQNGAGWYAVMGKTLRARYLELFGAEQAAIGANHGAERFTVLPDVKNRQATIIYENAAWLNEFGHRSIERLSFAQEDGAWKVARTDGNVYMDLTYTGVDDGKAQTLSARIDSLQQFALFYANDLGMPDAEAKAYIAAGDEDSPHYEDWCANYWSDPAEAAIRVFGLTGGEVTAVQPFDVVGKEYGATVTYRFADGKLLHIVTAITTLTPYVTYIPVDWYADGLDRTQHDLAQQWGRGMVNKLGQYQYYLMDDAMQKRFVDTQIEQRGDFSWKLIGSSPSVSAFTLAEERQDPAETRLVYSYFYVDWPDRRETETLHFGRVDGRLRVTDATDQMDNVGDERVRSYEQLQLLYDNALGLPNADYSDWLTYQLEKAAQDSAWLRSPEQAVMEWFRLSEDGALHDVQSIGTDARQVQLMYDFPEGGDTLTFVMEDRDGLWVPAAIGWPKGGQTVQVMEQKLQAAAEEWAAAYQGRDGRRLYELLTQDKAQTLMDAFAKASGLDPYRIEPGQSAAFWNFGTSSPSVDAHQVLSVNLVGELTADIVFQWRVSGAPKTRTLTRLTFEQDGDRLRVARIEGDCGGTPGAVRDGDYPEALDTLAGFEKKWGCGLGLRLPEVTLYDEDALAAYKELYQADLTKPAEAAVSLLGLAGGKLAGTSPCAAWGKQVGTYVDYVWPDGGVRILMMNQYDESGYTPVDWTYVQAGSRTGTNARADLDLAYQWATAMVEECGLYQWALLSDEARPDYWKKLINKDDEGWWSWRIGFGSSPNTAQFTLVPQEDGSIRVVYRLYDSGDPFYRFYETLRFGEENGRRIVTERSGLVGEFGNYIETAAEFLALYDNDMPPTYGLSGNDWLEGYEERERLWLEDPEQVARNFYQLSQKGTCKVEDGSGEATVIYTFPSGGGTLSVTLAHSEQDYPKAWLPVRWSVGGEYDTAFTPTPDYGPPARWPLPGDNIRASVLGG